MVKNYYLIIGLLFINVFVGAAQPGNTRASVQHTYASQVGIHELTGNNDGKQVEVYLKYVGLQKGNPWCAAFVCWVLGQNDVANPKSGYCPILFTAQNKIWKRMSKTSLIPLMGDVFGIYFPEKKRVAHVGFVDSWTSKTVITVEGNTNDAGSREGDGVYRKIRLTRQIYAVTRFIK
ncbi:CHAP domain-containing protein [Mucilaginibacter sp. HD30]